MLMQGMLLQFQGVPVTLTTRAPKVYEGIINGMETDMVRVIQLDGTTAFVKWPEVESVVYNPSFMVPQMRIVPAGSRDY